jgi:hypothetical protein
MNIAAAAGVDEQVADRWVAREDRHAGERMLLNNDRHAYNRRARRDGLQSKAVGLHRSH